MASGLGHDVALSTSSAESWKRRIWSIRIDMLKSAGQHRAGYAASICRRPALRHGLKRELLIVVIPPSLLRANAESDPRARSALNSKIQEIISWVLLGERWAAFKRIRNTLTDHTGCRRDIRLLGRGALHDRESTQQWTCQRTHTVEFKQRLRAMSYTVYLLLPTIPTLVLSFSRYFMYFLCRAYFAWFSTKTNVSAISQHLRSCSWGWRCTKPHMKVKLALPRRSRAAIRFSRGHTTFSNLVLHSRLELKVACLAVAEDSKLATSRLSLSSHR